MQFEKSLNNAVPGNYGKGLVLTTSKQTLKVFNFRPSLLSTARTNVSKRRNENRGGGGEKRQTNMSKH